MCGGGGIGQVFKDAFKLDPFDLMGKRKARRASAEASETLAAEQAQILEKEEKKRKQRKATATILTSGQGLGADQGGELGG